MEHRGRRSSAPAGTDPRGYACTNCSSADASTKKTCHHGLGNASPPLTASSWSSQPLRPKMLPSLAVRFAGDKVEAISNVDPLAVTVDASQTKRANELDVEPATVVDPLAIAFGIGQVKDAPGALGPKPGKSCCPTLLPNQDDSLLKRHLPTTHDANALHPDNPVDCSRNVAHTASYTCPDAHRDDADKAADLSIPHLLIKGPCKLAPVALTKPNPSPMSKPVVTNGLPDLLDHNQHLPKASVLAEDGHMPVDESLVKDVTSTTRSKNVKADIVLDWIKVKELCPSSPAQFASNDKALGHHGDQIVAGGHPWIFFTDLDKTLSYRNFILADLGSLVTHGCRSNLLLAQDGYHHTLMLNDSPSQSLTMYGTMIQNLKLSTLPGSRLFEIHPGPGLRHINHVNILPSMTELRSDLPVTFISYPAFMLLPEMTITNATKGSSAVELPGLASKLICYSFVPVSNRVQKRRKSGPYPTYPCMLPGTNTRLFNPRRPLDMLADTAASAKYAQTPQVEPGPRCPNPISLSGKTCLNSPLPQTALLFSNPTTLSFMAPNPVRQKGKKRNETDDETLIRQLQLINWPKWIKPIDTDAPRIDAPLNLSVNTRK